MDLTRREFLGYTVGAMSVMGAPLPQLTPPSAAEPRLKKWRVFSSNQRVLPESSAGYRAVLPPQRGQLEPWEQSDPMAHCSLVIMSSVFVLPEKLAERLRSCLQRGATVIIESGAGFANRLDFRKHRRSLREGLGLHVAAPVNLWSPPRAMPYVDYTWPTRTQVRDFTRLIPPAEQPGEIIAWAGDWPVALRRRVGSGTLIYIGSPLGPALLMGDVEAIHWLYTVARAA